MPPISLQCNSSSPLHGCTVSVHSKSSYIGQRYRYVVGLFKSGVITFDHVSSGENLAKPLIKGLTKDVSFLRASQC